MFLINIQGNPTGLQGPPHPLSCELCLIFPQSSSVCAPLGVQSRNHLSDWIFEDVFFKQQLRPLRWSALSACCFRCS